MIKDMLEEVDRKVDNRVGKVVFDVCFVVFLFLITLLFVDKERK